MLRELLRKKSPEQIMSGIGEGGRALRRTLGSLDLIALGIGAIVGAGIFVITGTAAAGDISPAGIVLRTPAGPAITLSFLLTAIACCCCALCYAEFATMIPAAGSAYIFTYVSLGELFAWVIGWALLLEYTFCASTIAVGWSGYLQQVLARVAHLQLPEFMTTPWLVALADPVRYAHFPHVAGLPLAVNLPSLLIIVLLTALLIRGIRESAKTNTVVVAIKLAVIAVFIVVGAFHVDRSNWVPYMPYGLKGVLAGSAVIFFAFIGFDALSTVSEEVRNPGRDLPIGIIGSLLICTVLYIIVSAVLTGIAPYTILNTPDPVATALQYAGLTWLASYIVSVGAVVALTSALLVMLMGQPRILLAMARDGFLPKSIAAIHPRYKTPYVSTLITALAVMFFAGAVDVDRLAELANIGTLFAFISVSLGIIILRYTSPHLARPFRTPLVPFIPLLGIVICIALIGSLTRLTWDGFVIWLVIGLCVYFSYGIRHTGQDAPPAPAGEERDPPEDAPDSRHPDGGEDALDTGQVGGDAPRGAPAGERPDEAGRAAGDEGEGNGAPGNGQ